MEKYNKNNALLYYMTMKAPGPDIHLHFFKKNEKFVLQENYLSTIYFSLMDYFEIHNHDENENMLQMVQEQAQILLMAMNRNNKESNNNNSPSSSVISEWNDEEQRNIILLSVTLTHK